MGEIVEAESARVLDLVLAYLLGSNERREKSDASHTHIYINISMHISSQLL